MTLTLTKEWRAQIEKWDQLPRDTEEDRKTIGRLVTEFLNVLQQRYKNSISFKQHYRRAGKQTNGGSYQANGSHFKGKITTATDSDRWTPIRPREAFKIEAHERPFDFIWVAENPENAQGEKNPHVHILLNWSVRLDQFHAWAQWIERTWGKGFAKLERIKKPAAAAHYMAKAANYISKGSNGEQGSIRGNRYNIAKEARPPKARQIGTYFADWLRDAVKLGQEAGREKWPEGLWFHKWGFGARTKAAWAQIWSVLKADGFRLKPKPAHLLNARAAEAVEQLLENTERRIEPMPDEYWNSLLNDNATAWAY